MPKAKTKSQAIETVTKYLRLKERFGDSFDRAVEAFWRIEQSRLAEMSEIVEVVNALESLTPIGYTYHPLAALTAAHNWLKRFPDVDIPKAIGGFAVWASALKSKDQLKISHWEFAIQNGLLQLQRSFNKYKTAPSASPARLSDQEKEQAEATREQLFNDVWGIIHNAK